MLSHDLRFLRGWWDQVVEGRAEFTLEGAQEFSTQLGLAIEAAEEIEAAMPCSSSGAVCADLIAEPETLPENVVRLRVAPRIDRRRAK